jgi:hypothetical protein
MCFHRLYIFGMHSSHDCSSWHPVDRSRHCQALLLESQSCVITAHSPIKLAIDIIKFMKPSKLLLAPKQPGTSQCAPPEDWYRKEFYRASDNVLDGGILWSPEFGSGGVKKGGLLDFYLAAKKWGLEFTREGDRLRPHYARFQDGGNYRRWIVDGVLLDWVLIDFRTTEPTVRHIGKHKHPAPVL